MRSRYPTAQLLVVTADGSDVGRLYRTEAEGSELWLLDVALLPEWRGRGIGSRLVTNLVAEADARGVRLCLHVNRTNRARQLYERLGFVVTGESELTLRMEHPGGGVS